MYESLKTILIIMSLFALKTSQCEKLNIIEKCKFFVLNNEFNIIRNLIQIRKMNFTHDIKHHFDDENKKY